MREPQAGSIKSDCALSPQPVFRRAILDDLVELGPCVDEPSIRTAEIDRARSKKEEDRPPHGGERARQAIDLVDDDHIHPAFPHLGKKKLQGWTSSEASDSLFR